MRRSPKRLAGDGHRALDDFMQTGRPQALDAAVAAFRRAVLVAQPSHFDRVAYLANLCMCLAIRFERAGERTDLDEAIDAGRQAVCATPPDHVDAAVRLSNLGGALVRRFEDGGDRADLDEAINHVRQAVDATPAGRPDRAMYLSHLGAALCTRFDLTGDRTDLDEAISHGREAVDSTPLGHPRRMAVLANLSTSITAWFGHAKDRADLDEAISVGRYAVAATPPGDPTGTAMLANLAVALVDRFGLTRQRADLDDAVSYGRQAVDATPVGHPDRSMYLSNLSAALSTRFDLPGDRADLDEAISHGREAVDSTPLDYPHRAGRLSNLGTALFTRFKRAGDRTDLDRAVDASREAAQAAPPGHPDRVRILSNLGYSLRARFDQDGDRADLDAAINASQEAADAIPYGHPDRATTLTSLGNFLRTRFQHAGDRADLDAAIEADEEAVDAVNADHPDRAVYLSNLGLSLHTRFNRFGDSADLDAAIDRFRQSSRTCTAAPPVRLRAARRWGTAAAAAARTSEAADGYAAAVALMPQVAWHGLNRSARQEQLRDCAWLPAAAAACAVVDGRAALAVEVLEQGRTLLWTQALHLRSDLTRLAAVAPNLAGLLESIRAVLDSPPAETPPLPEQVPAIRVAHRQKEPAEVRSRKAREWDEVIAQVRALEGFEHFLAATPYAELTAAVEGPVVLLNASRHGCHALIVKARSEQPDIVPLPNLNSDTAVDHTNRMLQALAAVSNPFRDQQEKEQDQNAVHDILNWLWDTIAEPVLTALGHTSPPGDDTAWPRVWWCPTGPLSVLPIHAAGYHPRLPDSAVGTDCVLDRVISSYTPNLAALARASRPGQTTAIRHLIIALPDIPGQPPLPAVRDELIVLARHFPPGPSNQQLAGPEATRTTVLTALASSSWVHFACHAIQYHDDPDRSGFALWDSALTIGDLASQQTQPHDLAYLSACQTATGSTKHFDEAIHLAAAMQFLGYQHVIATLWTIDDRPAPAVADAVYTTLTEYGRPQPGLAADALHHAVRALRRTDPADPLLWAPYVHLGP